MATIQETLAKAQKKKRTPEQIAAAAKAAGIPNPMASNPVGTQVQSPGTMVAPGAKVAGTSGGPMGDIAMAGLAKPTVATPQQPVMDRGVQTGFQMPDYSGLEAMDKKGLQDYLDSIDIRNMTGEKIPTEELLKARRAARMLQEQSAVGQVNPNEQILADLQAQKEAEAARLGQQNTQQFDTYRQQIEAQAEQARRRIEQQAQKQQQAMQSGLSFSGFGRSTLAVEKGNEIQQNASDALSAMELANQAELQRYQAELQGATAEQLAQYDEQIRNYQLQASQWEADSIQKTNELNQSLGLSYEQKINNLLEAATQTAKTYEDLTEAEQQAIMGYAGVILDDKGNIDSDVLKSIPAGLSAYVINEAAKLRGSLPGEAPDIQTIGKNQYGYFDKDGNLVRIGGGSGSVGSGGGGSSSGAGNRGVGGVTIPAGYSSSYNPALISTYTQFIENGKVPTQSQVKSLGGYETFASDANRAYIDTQNKILKAQSFNLTDPSFYASMTPDDRKNFKKDASTIKNSVAKIDSIISKVEKSGLPRQTLVGKGAQLQGDIRDLQLQLKGEGAYALGVLTGPDLSLLESVIPSADIKNWAAGKDQFITRLKNARQTFIDQINTNNVGNGVQFNPGGVSSSGGSNNTENNTTGAGSVSNIPSYLQSLGL